jgi:magnesium chelatase family protein
MTSSMMRDTYPINEPVQQKRAFILPQTSATETALVREAIIYPAKSLLEVCAHLSGHTALTQLEPVDYVEEITTYKHYVSVARLYMASQGGLVSEVAKEGGFIIELFTKNDLNLLSNRA